jgi:glycosyltransferase involved in cell wall biosynthesis
MTMNMISIVIPIHNESESLPALLEELDRVCAGATLGPVEYILVDDGSRDDSWGVIQRLAGQNPRVRAIRFRRNFGKAAALTAGFQTALGTVVFTLDADLQDDPAEIPRFLEKLNEGFDVISGWKQTRHDPWHKVYRHEVLLEVGIYGELHRFIPVLAHAKGFRVSEIVVRHRARKFGASHYGFTRFVKGLLDLVTVRFLTRFGQRPLHALGATGLVLLVLGVAGMLYLAVSWLDSMNRPIGNRPLLIYSASLLIVGMQLVSLGILAELVTSYNIRAEDTYSIAETLEARKEGHET